MSEDLKFAYELLNISEDATVEEIEAQFQKKKTEFVGGNKDEQDAQFFMIIKESYEKILDSKKLKPDFEAPFDLMKTNTNIHGNSSEGENNFKLNDSHQTNRVTSKNKYDVMEENKSYEKNNPNEKFNNIVNFFNHQHPNSETNNEPVINRRKSNAKSPVNSEIESISSNLSIGESNKIIIDETSDEPKTVVHQTENKKVFPNNLPKTEKEYITEPKDEIPKPVSAKPAKDNRKKQPAPFVRKRKQVAKCPPIECDVFVTLEEVLNGCTKNVKIKRKMETIGKEWEEELTFTIEVTPGMEANSLKIFEQQGHRSVKALPGDVIFTIKDKSYPHLKRIKNVDVEQTVCVLRSSKNDNEIYQINIPTFDQEPLNFKIKQDEINNDLIKNIPGRGLPQKGDIKTRGNLLVHVKLVDTEEEMKNFIGGEEIKENKTEEPEPPKEKPKSHELPKIKNAIEIEGKKQTEIKPKEPEHPVNKYNLSLSLNDILKGCTKEYSFQRKRFDEDKKEILDIKTLPINVKPGTPTGTALRFKHEGDQIDDNTFADVVFIVHDEHHPYLTRSGSDIKYVAKISRRQSESLSEIEIPTLENTSLKLQLTEEIVSNKEKRFFGRGLPYPSDTRMRGGFIVEFKVVSEQEASEFALKIKNATEEKQKEVFVKQTTSSDINAPSKDKQTQLPPNKCNLMLTLEDIERGCRKRTKFSRKSINANRETSVDEVYLEVPVRPGSIEGTQITLAKEGDREYAKIPADIIFTVCQEYHSIFKPNGQDIEYTANITPLEAIVGCTLKIPSLNNDTISLPLKGGITPETILPVENYGLPYLNEKDKRGNLLLHFNIIWGKETRQNSTIEYDLPLSLKQILRGEIIKVEFEKKVVNKLGNSLTEKRCLNIDVKPGTLAGTRYIFPREGDQEPGKIPDDIVYIARDIPEENFKRNVKNPADIEYIAKLTKVQFENGAKLEVPTLENITRKVMIDGITEKAIKRFQKLGLPYSDNPEKRGDIIVRFEIIPEKIKEKEKDIEYDLPLTLENILSGCTKRLKVNRRFYKSNQEAFEDKIVTINVNPGTEEGTKFRFKEYGDENLDTIPADIVFVARDKPHLNFKRNGANLIYDALITKREVSNGVQIEIPLLEEGKSLYLSLNDLPKSKNSKIYPGNGLPINGEITKRGDLIVKLEIVNDERKVRDMVFKLPISLNDVLYGCSKEKKITRIVRDLNGHEMVDEKTFLIDIKPGTEAGKRRTFPREGNKLPGMIPGDVVFIIDDETNDIFKRDGANIKFRATVSSSQALKCTQLEIPTLENKIVKLDFNKINKDTFRIIPGMGLPNSMNPNKRGDIWVNVDIIKDNSKEKYRKTLKEDGKAEKEASFEGKSVDKSKKSVENVSSNQKEIVKVVEQTLKPEIKNDPIALEIKLTLMEFFTGCTKIENYQRKIVDKYGTEKFEIIPFEINIPPGTENETRFIFENAGDLNHFTIPGDVIYVVKEIPHPLFKRKGVDLEYTSIISFSEFIKGVSRKIPTLDNDMFCQMKFDGPLKTEKTIEGRGMPYPENPDKRGNIVVTFAVNDKSTDKQTFSQKTQIENKLEVTLENILHGHTESINLPIIVEERDGTKVPANKTFKIYVKPGTKTGDRIFLPDEYRDKVPDDFVFVVQEKPHEHFRRIGADIEYVARITENETRPGCKITVPTLDNKNNIIICLKEQIDSDSVIKIPNKGLPFSNENKKRGNLVILFKISQSNKEQADSKNQEIETRKEQLPKDALKECDIFVTLEEIFKGCQIEQKVERVITDLNGSETIEEITLNVVINPGTETGKKICFEDRGDQHPGKAPGDIVVVIRDKPHRLFKRNGVDIIHKARINSTQASQGNEGFILEVPTLGQDNTIKYPIKEKIFHDKYFTIEDMGLPFPENLNKRGNLIITFDIINNDKHKKSKFNIFK